MKLFTQGHFKMGIKTIHTNRWRSFLTMSGVIIGVASVITVVSIGQGVKQQVRGQIRKFGEDLITVQAAPVGASTSGSEGFDKLATLTILSSLPQTDYGTVSTVHGIRAAVPLNLLNGQITGDIAASNTAVVGTSAGLPAILNQTIAYGSFFASDEKDDNVAVLGEHAAQRIFSENVPLGRSFTYRGEQFVVRGIFDAFDAAPLSGAIDFNNAVFIPYNTMQRLSQSTAPLYEVLAKPNNPKQLNQTIAAVDHALLKSHAGQHDFTIRDSAQGAAASSAILDILTSLVVGVAIVSLLVGGIGIMNVMLVSVTERMHEIGIRKAVGATNRQILNQFLTEATVLSVVGGLVGAAAAVIIDLVLRIFTSLQPSLTWQIVLLAVGVSVVIGVVFGSVPALKAARKQPIDALRNE